MLEDWLKGRAVGIVIACSLIAVVVACLVLAWGVGSRRETAPDQLVSMEAIPGAYWQKLAEKRVFFGHQSVGENIIDGVVEIVGEHPEIDLNIVESSDFDSINDGAILHDKIGRNTRFKSKLLAFKRVLDSSKSQKIDIAILKFCYIDVRRDSNPEELFDQYVSTLSSLEERHPDTTFVHSTVPIEARNAPVTRALKEAIKTLIGRPGVVDDNRVRQRYNELLRSTFGGRELVFDIARYEAVGPEGSLSYRVFDSERVVLMDGRYSDDGGHLNKVGRRKVAEQLMVTLALAANGRERSDLQ